MCNTTVHSSTEPMPVAVSVFKGVVVVRLGDMVNGIELYLDERDAKEIWQQLGSCLAQIKKASPQGAGEESTTIHSLPIKEDEGNVA